MSNTTVKFRGVAFEFGDSVLIVPPLSMAQLEEFSENLDKLTEQDAAGKGNFTLKTGGKLLKDNLYPPLRAALKRNYASISDAEITDFVTMENWGKIVGALLGAVPNGKGRTRESEVFPAGPQYDFGTSIGAELAPASPAPQAGVGPVLMN